MSENASPPAFDPSAPPTGPGCADCEAADPPGWWVHLRRCAACGHVGCCALTRPARVGACPRHRAPGRADLRAGRGLVLALRATRRTSTARSSRRRRRAPASRGPPARGAGPRRLARPHPPMTGPRPARRPWASSRSPSPVPQPLLCSPASRPHWRAGHRCSRMPRPHPRPPSRPRTGPGCRTTSPSSSAPRARRAPPSSPCSRPAPCEPVPVRRTTGSAAPGSGCSRCRRTTSPACRCYCARSTQGPSPS